MADWKDYLTYYKKKIEKGIDEGKTLDVIKKLHKAPITIELLQETGIGKIIKRLGKQDGVIGERASIVYEKWRDVVSKSSECNEKSLKSASDSNQFQNISGLKNELNKYHKSKDKSMNGHAKQSVESKRKIKTEHETLNHKSDYIEYNPSKKIKIEQGALNPNPDYPEYNPNKKIKIEKGTFNYKSDFPEYNPSKKIKIEQGALTRKSDYPEYKPTYSTHSKNVSHAEVSQEICSSNDFAYNPEEVPSKYMAYSDNIEFTSDMYNPEEPACDYVIDTSNSKEREKQNFQGRYETCESVNSPEYSSHSSPEQIQHSREVQGIDDRSLKIKSKTNKHYSGDKSKPCNNSKMTSKVKISKSDTHIEDVQDKDRSKKNPKVSKAMKKEVNSPKKSDGKEKSSPQKSSNKANIKLAEAEGFTCTEATFEDCLGFNDIVVVKKKKNHPKVANVSGKEFVNSPAKEVVNTPAKEVVSTPTKENSSTQRKRIANTPTKHAPSSNKKPVIPSSNHKQAGASPSSNHKHAVASPSSNHKHAVASPSSNHKHASANSNVNHKHSSSNPSSDYKYASSNQRQNLKTNSYQMERKQIKETAPIEDLFSVPSTSDRKVDISSTLPPIQPNYRPLRPLDTPPNRKKVLSNEEAIKFTSSRKEKTAVYSGRRNHHLSEVPTLVDICTKVLIENIDALECTGNAPYYLLKPVLERCSAKQLFALEDYNVYLLEDTADLWEKHCKKTFRNHQPPPGETWRDLYMRLYEEQEDKLKSITANISASMSKYNPARQTKLAYVDSVVKPPRDVARKQARNGTSVVISHSIKPVSGSKGNSPITGTSFRPGVSPSVKTVIKPKPAPLMMKTLKELKRSFRR